jgi:DNA-binding transcriptional regulator YiaG
MNAYHLEGSEFQNVVGSSTYDSYFSCDSADFEGHETSQYGLVRKVNRVFGNAISDKIIQTLKTVDGVYSLNIDCSEQNDSLVSETKQRSDVVAVSVPEMITTIKDVLGLNLSQLARIVNVSRPTVYNHLKGEGFADCYGDLYDIAVQVKQHYSSLSRVLKSVKVNGKTLLGHFQSGQHDQTLMIEYVHEAMKKQPEKVVKKIPHIEQVKRNLSSHR